MREYKIEKNIPVPDHYKSEYGKFPLGKMEVGDSFLVEMEGNENKMAKAQKIRSCVCHFGRRNKKKFSVRMVEKGVRVWRIDP